MTKQNDNEAAMIASILVGDAQLYHDLIRPHERSVYMMALSFVKNKADAEDIVQEAFLKAFCNLRVVSSLTSALMLATAFSAFGQMPVASVPTPLSQLLAEAETNNPQISVAGHDAQAAPARTSSRTIRWGLVL